MHEFNQSLSYDKKMYKADILGSQAYALGLVKAGILTSEEQKKIHEGLSAVLAEWENDKFVINYEVDEDIHTANERRLGEIIGTNISGKLHTGRSRNDQVATDMRIWLGEEAEKLRGWLKGLIAVIVNRAEKEIDALMPGYTHLQVSSDSMFIELFSTILIVYDDRSVHNP